MEKHEIFKSPPLSLCQLFQGISQRTWGLLRNSRESGINIGEETITEINLLEIALQSRLRVNIRQLNRREEGQIGADWQMWFIDRNGDSCGLTVQAKKIDGNMEYPHLNYRVGGNANGELQVDRLIRNSDNNPLEPGRRLMPVYVFYNYWNGYGQNLLECCKNYHRWTPNYGISFTDAFGVKRLINNNQLSLDDVAPIMLPWGCLVCCSDRVNKDATFVQRIFRLFKYIVAKSLGNEIQEAQSFLAEQKMVMREVPGYVDKISKKQSLDKQFDEMLAKNGIEGVAVIQEQKNTREF